MISVAFILKFIVAAVGAGTPLLFGTVGEIMSEKVGHLNLGVEGMMAIGAVAGFMPQAIWRQPWRRLSWRVCSRR